MNNGLHADDGTHSRREFIALGGAAGVAGLAGCSAEQVDDGNGNGENGAGENETDENEEEENGTDDVGGVLRVATYSSMVDGENPAGPWIKDAFEEEHPDAEIEWTVPESGVNTYIQQAQQGSVDADVHLGLNVDDLVRVDDNLDEGLFEPIDRDRIGRVDRIRNDLGFGDPDDRVLPFDTGYISLVYDESEVDAPDTFDDLLTEEYADALITQNAQTSDPGQAFLLWTIAEYGEDGYLDYWRDLQENGVRVGDDWTDTYFGAYMEEERPMIVSYSTDQVFHADEAGEADLTRHQVGFLDGQAYENPEGVAVFADSDRSPLAHEFIDFLLSSEAQAEIATRNVQFPAVSDEHVELGEFFDQYAHAPEEAVSLGYDELQGNLDGWVDDWAREIVQ